MSAFVTNTLTTAGIDVMAKTVAGGTLEFTKICVGDGALGSANPATRTALVHSLIDVPLTFVKVTGAGTATAEGTFTNEGRSTGFFYRELGLFAKDPVTKKEVLFAYGNAGDQAEWIPPSGQSTVVEKIIQIDTLIGNATKVTAQLKSGIYITNDALTEKLAPYALKTEVTPKADDSAVVHKAGTETVTGAKTFSAKITAPGGVQGNVTGNLTGTASKATADASGNVITTTYATKTENAAKANDNAVVHLAGTETVTGAKTYNTTQTWKASNTFAGSSTKGEAPTKNNNMVLTRTDKNGEVLQSILFGHMTSNRSRISLQASDCTGGTDTVAELNIFNNGGTTYATCPTPEDTANDTKIATTEWARKNCVDLTSVQFVTGNKYFSGGLFKKLDGVDVTTAPATNQYSFFDFFDKNQNVLARYQYCARNTGSHDLNIGIYDSNKTGKFLTLLDTGYLRWCNNDVLTTVNGMTLDTTQTISGAKTFKSGGIYVAGDGSYLHGLIFKHTNFKKNDSITSQIFDVIRFGGADYANSYATVISEMRQTRYADSDENYSGHNSLDFRISSNANTSANGMKALQLYSTGSMQWCGKEVLTTANGMDLASAQTVTGAKTFNASILANTGGAPALKTTANYGAELYMFPSTNATYKGCIILRARGEDGSFKDLYIRSDGSLTWCGKEVATQEFVTGKNYAVKNNAETIPGAWTFSSATGIKMPLVYPAKDKTYNLGDNGYAWKNGYIDNLKSTTIEGFTLTGDMNLKKSANALGSGQIFKNHSSTNDYGLTLSDINKNGSYSSVVIGNDTGGLDSKLKLCVNGKNYNVYGGHNATVVIKSWENGNSWYRLWSDGFMEYGDVFSATSKNLAVVFASPFKQVKSVQVTAIGTSSYCCRGEQTFVSVRDITGTGCIIDCYDTSGIGSYMIKVVGVAAN